MKPLTDVEGTQARLAAAHPFKGLGEPEDVAKAAVFLASDDASWVSGAALPVDGQLFPQCMLVAFRAVSLLASRWLHYPVDLFTAIARSIALSRSRVASACYIRFSQED